MSFIRLDLSLPTHPKTMQLEERAGPMAFGALVRLWLWAGHARTSGDLRDLSDPMIERVAGWTGEPGTWVGAAASVGFLDGAQGQRRIHDWAEHQPWIVTEADRVKGASAAATARWRSPSNRSMSRRRYVVPIRML